MDKTYLVQVEGDPDSASLEALRHGVRLKDGLTQPADVERIAPPIPALPAPVGRRVDRGRELRLDAAGAAIARSSEELPGAGRTKR